MRYGKIWTWCSIFHKKTKAESIIARANESGKMGRPSRYKIHTRHYQKEAADYRNHLLVLGYAEGSIQSRYNYLKAFFCFLEQRGVDRITDITAVEIDQFYTHIRERGSTRTGKKLKPKTVYDSMRCVQMYLGYGQEMGKITDNSGSHLQLSYPDRTSERRILSRQEIDQLYAATETQQERAILHMGYGCGLRVREMSDLNREDIRLREQVVIVQKGKNSKRRLVPFTEKVGDDLSVFLREQEQTQAVFTHNRGGRMKQWTFNKRLNRLLDRTPFGKKLPRAERNKIGIHALRHSIATQLIKEGMKLEQVRQFLGHAYIESTETYTHISAGQLKNLQRC